MENNETYEKDPFEIGLLWKNVSKKGNKYYKGAIMIGGAEHKITLFKIRTNKVGDNIPYFKVLLDDPNYKKNKDSRPVPKKEVEPEINVEDIPF